jgi:hypothetical protein
MSSQSIGSKKIPVGLYVPLLESGRFRGVTPLSWPALEGGNPDTSAGRYFLLQPLRYIRDVLANSERIDGLFDRQHVLQEFRRHPVAHERGPLGLEEKLLGQRVGSSSANGLNVLVSCGRHTQLCMRGLLTVSWPKTVRSERV